MAVLTPQQITAINTKLSVSLATLTDDKIIELCLLQRAAPEVKPAFVEALNTEITRRFTAAEIAANDVMFSVIQNFANQFTSGIPFFAKKMLEMSASVNRDIWFSNNSSMFAQAIEDETLLEWLITQPDVVTKILNNTLGLTAIAKSTKASSAILSNAETAAIFKGATNVWQIVTGQAQLMSVLVLSNDLMTYVIENNVAMNVVAASSTAMTAVAASTTAMTAVAASSTALSAIVKSTSARNALMENGTVFQSVKAQIYTTVKASWSKQVSVQNTGTTSELEAMTSAVASPVGIVLAQVFNFDGSSTYTQKVTHSNGVVALNVTRFTGSQAPSSLSVIDVISFNGVVFTGSSSGAYGYAELWIPPAT